MWKLGEYLGGGAREESDLSPAASQADSSSVDSVNDQKGEGWSDSEANVCNQIIPSFMCC